MSTEKHTAEHKHVETEVAVDPRIGQVLQDRYQIIERLAAGGMGVVYRGERLQLGRPVAIKFLHGTFAVASEARLRFEREAMASARLSHPNCVSVFDIGVDNDGSPYIVMEYLIGQTLRQVLQQEGRLEPGRALYITGQILGALAYAHSQDMVHRDIKPANILLSNIEGAQDHVFLLDFGLAKVVGNSALGDITRSNVVLGTPSYMSPEQARGEPTLAPSDVYSTGIVLFEMLAGQRLFYALRTLDVLMAHQNAPVPRLSRRVPEQAFSQELEAVVKKALAKSPHERYATAAEFAAALSATPEANYKPRRMSADLADEPRSKTIQLAETKTSSEPPPAEVPTRIAPHFRPATGTASTDSHPAQPAAMRTMAPYLLALVPVVVTIFMVWAIARKSDDGALARKSDGGALARKSDGGALARRGNAGSPEAPAAARVPAAAVQATEAAHPDASVAPATWEHALTRTLTRTGAQLTDSSSARSLQPPRPRATEVADVADVEALIKQGQREEAIRGILKLLRSTHEANPYLNYLLGNLYFEKVYWGDALDAYLIAAKADPKYRRLAKLNENAIRALSHDKTRDKVNTLYVRYIRRAGLPYLKQAAKSDKNPIVRKRAQALVSQLSRGR